MEIYRKSIRTKLILALIALLILTIFSFWFMNKVFLPGYYEYSKVSMLSESFARMNVVVQEDSDFSSDRNLSDESMLYMEQLEANRSLNIYMFEISNFLDSYLYYTFDYPELTSMSEMQKEDVREKTYDYVVSLVSGQLNMKGKELLQSHDRFNIYKVYDERIGSYYLEVFGQMDSGSFIYMRTNYQSMQDSIAISNRFLGYIGCGVILLGAFLMLIISNSFTKPILQLTDIAQRMAQLDFEAKYPVTTQDEIGRLGNSMNQLSEQLETTISELKTANNELQKDIERKTQIDEMRKEFLSNVSHELKTPIALIQGYAEGLADNINDDSESRQFYCDVIIDEANKMNKMVKKLLTLNQIEFGNNAITFERFDIVQVLRSVAQSAQLLAEQKGASIVMQESEPLYVWADEYMVEEVITNYVSNAINHVDGEKRIEIMLERKQDVVRISVFNTGQPIPEEELDKIWIKFYKVDKARTRAYGGSGIGLSIVKAIMDSLNQKCGVRNVRDGVAFWFELDSKN